MPCTRMFELSWAVYVHARSYRDMLKPLTAAGMDVSMLSSGQLTPGSICWRNWAC